MITAIVRFKLPANVTLDAATELFKGSAPKYQNLPGLIRKYYLYGEGQGGGADVAVSEHEPTKQSGVRSVGGVVEIAIAVHEEQEHVSVSQIGAGRNPFSAVVAVLVSER